MKGSAKTNLKNLSKTKVKPESNVEWMKSKKGGNVGRDRANKEKIE